MARDADPDTIFNLVAEEAAQLFGAGSGRVARFDGAESVLMGGWAAMCRRSVNAIRYRGHGRSHPCNRTGLPSRVDNYTPLTGDDAWLGGLVNGKFLSGIAAPIWVAETLWGALLVLSQSDSPHCRRGAERRLQRFAELIALAISGAQARQSLEHQATSDPLTGLPNRPSVRDSSCRRGLAGRAIRP